MQFHPLAYIVKLKIELSMADLIAKIARSRETNDNHGSYFVRSRSDGTRAGANAMTSGHQEESGDGRNKAWATVTTTLEMKTMDRDGRDMKKGEGSDSDLDSLIEAVSAIPPATGPQGLPGAGSVSSYATVDNDINRPRQDNWTNNAQV